MTCAEFLERYTDFRDGLITAPRELRRFERHLVRCAGCRRYDTAVRRGVLALQAAGTIEPSRDFRRRLDARLERERRAAREVPASAGVAAALVLAAALARTNAAATPALAGTSRAARRSRSSRASSRRLKSREGSIVPAACNASTPRRTAMSYRRQPAQRTRWRSKRRSSRGAVIRPSRKSV